MRRSSRLVVITTTTATVAAVLLPAAGVQAAARDSKASHRRSVDTGRGRVLPTRATPGARRREDEAAGARRRAAQRWTITSHTRTLPNGQTTERLYALPHFRRTASGWKPLSAELHRRGGAVRAPGTLRPFTFGDAAGSLLTIGSGAGPLRMSVTGLQIGRPSVGRHTVTYSDAAPETTLHYQVLPDRAEGRPSSSPAHRPLTRSVSRSTIRTTRSVAHSDRPTADTSSAQVDGTAPISGSQPLS
jgi:hypothetical protein